MKLNPLSLILRVLRLAKKADDVYHTAEQVVEVAKPVIKIVKEEK